MCSCSLLSIWPHTTPSAQTLYRRGGNSVRMNLNFREDYRNVLGSLQYRERSAGVYFEAEFLQGLATDSSHFESVGDSPSDASGTCLICFVFTDKIRKQLPLLDHYRRTVSSSYSLIPASAGEDCFLRQRYSYYDCCAANFETSRALYRGCLRFGHFQYYFSAYKAFCWAPNWDDLGSKKLTCTTYKENEYAATGKHVSTSCWGRTGDRINFIYQISLLAK